jgi:hypothetical protein
MLYENVQGINASRRTGHEDEEEVAFGPSLITRKSRPHFTGLCLLDQRSKSHSMKQTLLRTNHIVPLEFWALFYFLFLVGGVHGYMNTISMNLSSVACTLITLK